MSSYPAASSTDWPELVSYSPKCSCRAADGHSQCSGHKHVRKCWRVFQPQTRNALRANLTVHQYLAPAYASFHRVMVQRYLCWMHTTPTILLLMKMISTNITKQQVGSCNKTQAVVAGHAKTPTCLASALIACFLNMC